MHIALQWGKEHNTQERRRNRTDSPSLPDLTKTWEQPRAEQHWRLALSTLAAGRTHATVTPDLIGQLRTGPPRTRRQAGHPCSGSLALKNQLWKHNAGLSNPGALRAHTQAFSSRARDAASSLLAPCCAPRLDGAGREAVVLARHLVASASRLRRPPQERLAFAPPLKSLTLQKGGAGWGGEANSVFGFQVTQVGVKS